MSDHAEVPDGHRGAQDVGDPMEVLKGLYGPGVAELGDLPAATYWPGIPALDAGKEWTELRDWVRGLQDRFSHLDHHVIPGCWWRHNEHVEALVALRDHERVSFTATAPPTAPADWFRALRDLSAMMRSWASDSGCGAAHNDPSVRLKPLDSDAWEVHVAGDVARRQQHELDAAIGS
jgi:hypothetical protein